MFFYAHVPADNPVFWTLKVEAQYYIFIGLFFPLLTAYRKYSVVFGVPVLLLLSHTAIADQIDFFRHIVFFLMGTVGYLLYYNMNDSLNEMAIMLVLVVFACFFDGIVAGSVSFLTVLTILLYRKPVNGILEHPGIISYSIYLIHFPIGVKLINFGERYLDPSFHWALFIVALVVCYGLAWAFWRYIETPSALLSNKVKYGRRPVAVKSNQFIKDQEVAS